MSTEDTIALVGPIDDAGIHQIRSRCEGRFRVIEVKSEADYNLLEQASYIVLRTLKINSDTIGKLKRTRLIQRWGSGFDSVDIQAAGRAGIPVAVCAGINAVPVAEYTVMLILALMRNIISAHKSITSGSWRDESLISRSYTIAGKTAGIVGFGNIGKHVARILKSFGATVTYFDTIRLSQESEELHGVAFVPFEQMVRDSDILSLHIPLNDETRNLVDERVLSSMKATSILVNTSRGGIVDEDALYRHLMSGSILGAGIDAFYNEPVTSHPLFNLPNVVLSGHIAGNTGDNSIHMADRCCNNIFAVSRGEALEPPDLVNGQFLTGSAANKDQRSKIG